MSRPATVAITVLCLSALSVAVARGTEGPRLDPYRAAVSRGETGVVDVRAYTERRKPAGPDVPTKDVVVALVPSFEALIAEIELVKSRSRDSLDAYRTAALRIRRILEAYAKSLTEAGGADLVRSNRSRADGWLSFRDVAAGQWLLLSGHETRAAVTPRKRKSTDREKFAPTPGLVGYRLASFWVIPVTVSSGIVTTVELTDRNVWFTGVIEETER